MRVCGTELYTTLEFDAVDSMRRLDCPHAHTPTPRANRASQTETRDTSSINGATWLLSACLSADPEGGSVMHTPNFERIAKQSVVFERAYVMVALCMPSRTSLLTGRRPDTSRSWTIEVDQWFRNSAANWTTLPGRFKDAGYLTMGMGKIFHETMPSWDPQDARVSWSPEAFYETGGQRGKGGLFDPPGIGKEGAGALAHRFPDEEEPRMQDGNITDHAVATIQKMAAGEFGADVASGARKFFLAVGFVSSLRLLA